MSALRNGLLVLAVGAWGCDPGSNLAPDTCAAPASGGITAVFTGPADDTFVPWIDGAIIVPQAALQSGLTLQMRFRLDGAGVPACVPHRSQVFLCGLGQTCATGGDLIADEDVPLRTYVRGSAHETHVYNLELRGNPQPTQPVRLESTLGGVGQVLALWVDAAGTLADAGSPDGAPPDAAPPDAAPPDAAP